MVKIRRIDGRALHSTRFSIIDVFSLPSLSLCFAVAPSYILLYPITASYLHRFPQADLVRFPHSRSHSYLTPPSLTLNTSLSLFRSLSLSLPLSAPCSLAPSFAASLTHTPLSPALHALPSRVHTTRLEHVRRPRAVLDSRILPCTAHHSDR